MTSEYLYSFYSHEPRTDISFQELILLLHKSSYFISFKIKAKEAKHKQKSSAAAIMNTFFAVAKIEDSKNWNKKKIFFSKRITLSFCQFHFHSLWATWFLHDQPCKHFTMPKDSLVFFLSLCTNIVKKRWMKLEREREREKNCRKWIKAKEI